MRACPEAWARDRQVRANAEGAVWTPRPPPRPPRRSTWSAARWGDTCRAVGRRPRTQDWGLESLQLDRKGNALRIDDQCRTSMRDVWAIGDIAGEPMLAHRAMAQGEMVAELVAGKRRHFQPAAIPAVCFTDPEVVVAGLSPAEAESAGLDCLTASFPFAANGRSMTLESTDGFVRVVARRMGDTAHIGRSPYKPATVYLLVVST